ncbi:hypothetical protein [Microbacterium sediminis]|uniref:Uncharacterized protein n=1 Tax=Microbacterium sediminis TaxID=904291 RepID=A0A1B9NGB7_9MICO|nr:hypothetical protein [Microbacterium sediminis]OCG75661.1 hypothetical protein A7J15_00980 [Microbacterium sediminis]QBR74057.1 hypothetical protein E3O41_06235 [Microbacterium sediminis]
MPALLRLADADSAHDALTFAGRAAQAGSDGVRLQGAGGVLAMTAAALAPQGLLDRTPTVLAMRVLAADPELQCDLVVAELTATDEPVALALPDTAIAPAWAGVAPPRGGWERRGEIAAATLASRAQWGIAAVAERLPQNPGEDAVRAVRGAVWGTPDEELHGLPLGVAFAAFAFGFIGGEEDARVMTSGRWTRVTLRRGHVLARGPVVSGLTAVRTTGR